MGQKERRKRRCVRLPREVEEEEGGHLEDEELPELDYMGLLDLLIPSFLDVNVKGTVGLTKI